MAKELEITPEHSPGLVDSDTYKSIVALKVVDVTEECPKATEKRPSIFLYTFAQRGLIIQMCRPNEGQTYVGTQVHFFIDDLDEWMKATYPNDPFGSWAERLGLTKVALQQLIIDNMPLA